MHADVSQKPVAAARESACTKDQEQMTSDKEQRHLEDSVSVEGRLLLFGDKQESRIRSPMLPSPARVQRHASVLWRPIASKAVSSGKDNGLGRKNEDEDTHFDRIGLFDTFLTDKRLFLMSSKRFSLSLSLSPLSPLSLSLSPSRCDLKMDIACKHNAPGEVLHASAIPRTYTRFYS
jgi:hypothetical protein